MGTLAVTDITSVHIKRNAGANAEKRDHAVRRRRRQSKFLCIHARRHFGRNKRIIRREFISRIYVHRTFISGSLPGRGNIDFIKRDFIGVKIIRQPGKLFVIFKIPFSRKDSNNLTVIAFRQRRLFFKTLTVVIRDKIASSGLFTPFKDFKAVNFQLFDRIFHIFSSFEYPPIC